jgi:tetratricopeptide (TPR) repeat protein
VNRDDATMDEIRRVEQVIAQLVTQVGTQRDSKTMALSSYRDGEQAMAARRYYDALQAFDNAAKLAPGSFLAFLATYQIGRVSFERTSDYAVALEAYESCLADYPANFFASDSRSFLEARVAMLKGTREAGSWNSLRLWHQAERATSFHSMVGLLEELIGRTSYEPLTAEAANRAVESVTSDARGSSVDPGSLLRVLGERARVMREPAQEARVRFAMGELLMLRFGRLADAATEYRRVLDLTADSELRAKAATRLKTLEPRVSDAVELRWPATH